MSIIKGETRQERINYQLDEWAKGNSIHNDVDNECCPDFSCCTPELLASEEERKTFKAMSEQGKDTMGMLGVFLGKAIDRHYEKKGKKNEVYIATGENPENN